MDLISIIAALFFALVLIITNVIWWRKFKKFDELIANPDHRATKSLIINKISTQYDQLDKEIEDLYEINNKFSKVTKRSICKIGVNRFNALGEKGNGQSFALTLLNFKDSGIIVSTLQTSQGNRIFVRDVKEGTVEGSPLSQEEKIALERAKQVVF